MDWINKISWFYSQQGQEIFLFFMVCRLVLGPNQPPIHCIMGAKLPGSEDNHSGPSRIKVMDVWSYISAPPFIFMAMCLIKKGANVSFTFTLIIAV
jgi:hypothetical protein